MNWLIPVIVLLFSVYSFADDPKPTETQKQTVRQIGREMDQGGLDDLAQKVDAAINNMIEVAAAAMDERDFALDSKKIRSDWASTYKGSIFIGLGDIGDHPPLSEWLAAIYELIEADLGVDMCKKLHLSDIKTLNYCIPIVFAPCTFPMNAITIAREVEYQKHFAEGDVYYGLVPVITYWIVDVACMVATSGTASLLCPVGADASEWFMGKIIAPRLSNKIFERYCPDGYRSHNSL